MSFGKHISIEDSMSETMEVGAGLAWRLLATLEGGSLLLATCALIAYTVRNKIARPNKPRGKIRNVLVTSTTNLLGRELKRRLEAHGCTVSNATNGTRSTTGGGAHRTFDALIVVGAESAGNGLNGVAGLVTEDVYANLKILESLSGRVRRGGYMAWACADESKRTGTDAFRATSCAFDTVLHTSLQHIAKASHCKPVWVGRCQGADQAAERVVAALMSCATSYSTLRFSVRNAVHKAGQCVCRWLKIVT